MKPGTVGPAITQNDFNVNGPLGNVFIPEGNFLTQLLGRERRYGGTVNVDYDPTDWLKFYDHFIIQRNEETSTTPNQGFSGGDPPPGPVIVPANNPYNPWHVPLVPLPRALLWPNLGRGILTRLAGPSATSPARPSNFPGIRGTSTLPLCMAKAMPVKMWQTPSNCDSCRRLWTERFLSFLAFSLTRSPMKA